MTPREKLDSIERRIASLERAAGSTIRTGHGDIGGIRSWSNKRKQRASDRRIDACVELAKLYPQRDGLKSDVIQLQMHGPFLPPPRKPTREELAAAAFKVFSEHWQVGGFLDVGGNSPLKIVKKNRLSILTEGGSKWTFEELTGFTAKEAGL